MDNRRWLWTLAALIAAFGDSAGRAAPAPDIPAWAYPELGTPAREAPATIHTLAGSAVQFTHAELIDQFRAVEWRPDRHAPAPRIVLEGRHPDLRACGFCHMPDGEGRPENAALAGLPATYILEQLRDLATGGREDAVADWHPGVLMRGVAGAVTYSEAVSAADYFSHLKYRSRVRVVEAVEIPAMTITAYTHRPDPSGGRQPLGARIIETPDDFDRFELRDSTVSYTAYAPPGAITHGRDLALGGAAGRSLPCAACHGRGLRGAIGPPIAGRSPTYLFRQLYTFKTGERHGAGAAPMAAVAAGLSQDEMIDLSAYVATLKP